MVIDKFNGCNHVTCICRHEFCYVCGADWTPAHHRSHDETGLFIIPPIVNQIENEIEDTPKRRVCFYLTLIPRIIIAMILLSLLTPLFAGCIGISILAKFCRTGNCDGNEEGSCILYNFFLQLLKNLYESLLTP
jgi:hypothetical protein